MEGKVPTFNLELGTTTANKAHRLSEALIVGFAAILMLTLSGCVRRIIDDPVFIVGGDNPRAGLTCNREFEAIPCSVVTPAGDTAWFASLGFNRMTFAQGDWSNWSAGPPGTTQPGFAVPIKADDPFSLQSLTGDSWATYSATKNLAFFYFIGRPPPSVSNSCVAVAATAPEKLSSGEWDFPATCLSSSRGDQCAILHIDATNTFYAACAFSSDGPNIRIQAFDNCEGAPGPGYGCPRTALVDIPDVNQLQFTISENPCTGHLALVYRKRDEIRLRFYDENLREVSDTLIRDNQSFSFGQTNAGCTNGTIRRCGQGTPDCTFNGVPGQCIRNNARPSIDTYKWLTGGRERCGAVLAYDSLVKAQDGNLWSKSRLDLLDITDERAPVIEAQWNSTAARFAWNHYLSYATVTNTPPYTRRPRISWFWLTDIRGPCQVIAEGATSTDLAGSMQVTGIIGGPFPAIHTDVFGIGDYFGGVRGGDYQGSLLVSWGEPVRTTSPTCVPCMGENWNLSTKIARIRWAGSARPETPLGRELEAPLRFTDDDRAGPSAPIK
jgi:hypothetical protein